MAKMLHLPHARRLLGRGRLRCSCAVLDALEANPPAELISSDKTINVAAATQLFEAVGDAAPSLAECAETVESLPQFALPQLEEIMGPARQKLSEVSALVQGAADFSPLAAPVLGAKVIERT